jgi:hypothetical protein
MRRALLFAPLWLLVAACAGKGNTGRNEVDPALQAAVPWLNGYPPALDATKSAVVPAAPVYPPIGPNTPDPGSRVVFDTDEHRAQACKPLAGIELSSWHHDFEPVREVPGSGNLAGTIGVAQFFSAYDDKTDGSWHVPGDASWYSDVAGGRGTIPPPPSSSSMTPLPPWGLAADAIPNGPSCDGTANNWALHIRGGRFNYYGGGAEHPFGLDCTLGGQLGDVCDHQVDVVGDGRADLAIDASAYDGIAFWARRGPDGASGLMINLQNKYTSDRLARTDGVTGKPGVGYCKRIKQCIPTCADGASCVPMQLLNGDPVDMHRCVPEGADPKQAIMEPALQQLLFPPCGQSTCVPPGYDPDLDYDDTQCKPYNFTGLEENNYCFGDTPPPAADERCGDGYVSNISLSTDWQFYKLPFDRFQQVGFAKKVPATDKLSKTLYSIAFLFSVGYADFYVDNLSFYRNAN